MKLPGRRQAKRPMTALDAKGPNNRIIQLFRARTSAFAAASNLKPIAF